MKRALLGVAFLTSVLVPMVVGGARPALASWVGSHCAPSHSSDSNYRRLDAEAYDNVAEKEGYEWGGGCWNNNDKDDSPNAPDSSGEGPDCSGLVFKTWELMSTYGKSGFEFWDKLENIHGPYTAASYHAPSSSVPFEKLPDKKRTTTTYMDAFSSTDHTSLISSTVSSNQNYDWISEAKGEIYGTNEYLEDYRYASAFVATKRDAWTPDCWPNCHSGPAEVVVIP